MTPSQALPSQIPEGEWSVKIPLLGLTINRTALELTLFALGIGVILGANVQRAADRATPCPDCERIKDENLRAIREGGRRFLEGVRETQGEGVAGSEARGEAHTHAPTPAGPPAAPSPGVSKDEPPIGRVVVTEEGGIFPEIPLDPNSQTPDGVPRPLFDPERVIE